MDKLRERLLNSDKEERRKLRRILINTDVGSEWEKVMNILYSGSKGSILTAQNSELFDYFSEVFKDTAFLDEMLRLLEELEESVDSKLEKIDRLYLQAVGSIDFLLEFEVEAKTNAS